MLDDAWLADGVPNVSASDFYMSLALQGIVEEHTLADYPGLTFTEVAPASSTDATQQRLAVSGVAWDQENKHKASKDCDKAFHCKDQSVWNMLVLRVPTRAYQGRSIATRQGRSFQITATVLRISNLTLRKQTSGRRRTDLSEDSSLPSCTIETDNKGHLLGQSGDSGREFGILYQE